MKLFDETIRQFNTLIENKKGLNPIEEWPSSIENEFIFKGDSAFELGGGSLEASSLLLLTDNNELVDKDEVLVIGKEMKDIKKDCDYARIVLINVDDEKMGKGNALYQTIRKIDYTRYHIFPKGFMMRISSMNKRESVIVSKKALKEGIDFNRVGKTFINAYKKNPAVRNVKIIFITDPNFNFSELNKIENKVENMVKALDHLVNKVSMDCHSCSLQVVCAEVETLCKEEFKN